MPWIKKNVYLLEYYGSFIFGPEQSWFNFLPLDAGGFVNSFCVISICSSGRMQGNRSWSIAEQFFAVFLWNRLYVVQHVLVNSNIRYSKTGIKNILRTTTKITIALWSIDTDTRIGTATSKQNLKVKIEL